jgi:hypothetical protein
VGSRRRRRIDTFLPLLSPFFSFLVWSYASRYSLSMYKSTGGPRRAATGGTTALTIFAVFSLRRSTQSRSLRSPQPRHAPHFPFLNGTVDVLSRAWTIARPERRERRKPISKTTSKYATNDPNPSTCSNPSTCKREVVSASSKEGGRRKQDVPTLREIGETSQAALETAVLRVAGTNERDLSVCLSPHERGCGRRASVRERWSGKPEYSQWTMLQVGGG